MAVAIGPALIPTPTHTPFLPDMLLLADQQTTSLLESPVAGGRERGRAGVRAGPEPYTCFKLQDLVMVLANVLQ